MSSPANAPGRLRTRADDPALVEADLPAPAIQNHAANLMVLANGDLGCVWFGGTQEGAADISIWFSRLSQGASAWTQPVKLSNDATRSEQNPILFPAPDGRLWLLHTAQRSGNQDTALVRYRISNDNGETWGPPGQLFGEPGIFVRHPVVVLDNDDWLLAAYHCRTAPGVKWVGDNDESCVMISSDQGGSWSEVAVPDSTGCVHMSIVKGHNALLGFFRSRWADHVYVSRSTDDGRTWCAPKPTSLPNNNSSIQVTRLENGHLAIAYNDISAAQATERRLSLYDEIGDDDGPVAIEAAPAAASGRTAFWGTPRAPMTIAVSADDGETWPWKRNLEVGDGYCMTNNSKDKSNREYSYPSILQSSDGAINIAYTVFRQKIRHVRFREEWITPAGHASANT